MPASNTDIFVRTISVFRDKHLTPRALSDHLAREARTSRDKYIADEMFSPTYETYVDGRLGAVEESVRPDGVIRYKGAGSIGEAVLATRAYLRDRSPVLSGDFAKYWIVVVDQRQWTLPFSLIPAGSTVWIVNVVPYARKIETGGMKTRKPPYMIYDAIKHVEAKYPRLEASRLFVRVPPGLITLPKHLGPQVPYRLRGHAVRSGLSWQKIKRKFERIHEARPTNARDRREGAEMTYPAIQINGRS